MRRNRKKHVQMDPAWSKIIGIFALGVTVVVIYGVVDAKCGQLGQEIRKQELRYASLENERVREAARWDEKKTPEKLERAMLQHGLAMGYAMPSQIVRMDALGRPLPGQLSLAKYKKSHSATERVVKSDQQ